MYSPITDLKVGDEFEYLNGPGGYPCKVTGLVPTPTGRFSVQYTFGMKSHKQNKTKEWVRIKPPKCLENAPMW